MQRNIIIVLSAILLSSCASVPLEPRCERVIASHDPAPKRCKYLAQVSGNQGNFFTGQWTSNENLEVGAMNDLKNKAGKIGANYVQVVNSRAGKTGASNGAYEQTNVTNIGNAYQCPPEEIGLG